eukprot:CAMPEP_0172480818 /NCGR_PEP_ID=MMETSP1066-20121228/6268_1 /TAXON_ID=671091 /ORGANISM="Coscinodiscus wailesii, Strain CCMP2513" /LENGTH=197 /DNA_ID=CAMNT_0013242515 /DNA_START=359 /DNA_END=952 /DNA_ORIENTATION=+
MYTKSAIVSALIASASAFVPSTRPVSQGTRLNLSVGETAPDFTLQDQNGKSISRSKINKPLVVYFYPADATPGCTVQAESFNEQVKDIRKNFGAELVGISGQDVESKQAFAKELGLGFSILADDGDEVRSAFKVPKAAFGFLPGRVTYVLDKNGVCVSVYDNLGDAKSHVKAATDALEELAPSSSGSGNPLLSFFNK